MLLLKSYCSNAVVMVEAYRKLMHMLCRMCISCVRVSARALTSRFVHCMRL
jgi:hypothetical protein